MQKGGFEEKIQKQMFGFGLQPSEEVWVQVEKRIRQKKRRRFIFWWPVAALLLTGGWLLLKQNIGEGNYTSNTNTADNESLVISGTNRKSDTAEDKQADTAYRHSDIILPAAVHQSKAGVNILPVSVLPATGKKRLLPHNADSSLLKAPFGDNRQKKSSGENDLVSQPDNEPGKRNFTDKEREGSKSGNEPSLAVIPQIQGTVVTVSANTAEENLVGKQGIPVTVKVKPNGKWQWSTGLSLGRTILSDGFVIGANKSAGQYDAALFQGTNPASGGQDTFPPEYKPALLFSAHIKMEKGISRQLKVSVAAGYSGFSSKTDVGSPSSSNLQLKSVYGPATSVNSNVYVNHLHFATVFAGISWRILDKRKLSLNWENELSYQRLVASNMLHFSYSDKVFYKDNSLLNKNQYAFTTSLLLNLGQRWQAGPFLTYSFRPVASIGDLKEKHLNGYGIRVNYFTVRKK